ncbi:MAG: WD40 repeat domain-containing protein, partial [Bacteroidota bacterium]
MLTQGAFAQLPIQWGDAVVTCEGFNAGSPVFGIMRIQNANTAPLNINWAPPMVHPANWTLGNFGEVFGIAIDPSGDIYVTSTSCYGVHTYTASGPGTIFKVSGTTGLVIWSTPLPNDVATHPALGNVCYDPDHRQLFVTNMEDGKIYRINATTGATINTFDPFGADGGSPGFAPRGERLWGVAYRKTSADNGIVYFSRWQEDMTHPSSLVSNEIHSINLDAVGNFTGGTTLRITVPALPGNNYSNPVSDIEFSSAGLMLLGERTMYGDDQPLAHQSRMLEYQLSLGVWIPSGHTFDVGALTNFGIKANAAGGVDYGYRGFDSKKGQTLNCDSMAWATGDALHFVPGPVPPTDYNYGMQGFPATGGSIANSVLIDFDGDTTNQAKTQLGDVDVYKNCAVDVNPCLQRRFQLVSDPQAPAGSCCWILTLTNNFSATFWTQVQLNIISGGTFSGASAQPGWTVGLTPASVHFTPPGAGFMPIGNSIFRYCLAATTVPQRVQVVWIGVDGTRCYDTLFTDCPPPPKLCARLTGVKIACGQVVNGQQQYTMGFQIFNSTSLPFT